MSRGNFDPIRSQRHSPIGAALGAGAVLASGVAVSAVVVLAGCTRGRIYWQDDVGGALELYPLRADRIGLAAGDRYDTPLATATVVADTETTMDFASSGEHGGVVIYTPVGDGTLATADIARV